MESRGRRAVIKVVRGFGYVWFVLVGLLIPLSIVGTYMATGSIMETWDWVAQTFSPFNIINLVFTVIVASPGVGALVFAERMEERQ